MPTLQWDWSPRVLRCYFGMSRKPAKPISLLQNIMGQCRNSIRHYTWRHQGWIAQCCRNTLSYHWRYDTAENETNTNITWHFYRDFIGWFDPRYCIKYWRVLVCGHIVPTEVLRSNLRTEVFKVNLSIFYYLGVLSYVPHTLRFIFLKGCFCFPSSCLMSRFGLLEWRSSSTRPFRMSLMVASVVLMKLI